MNSIWLYTLLSTAAVSLIALAGIITLSLKEVTLQKILLYLVSFSAGALLGDALFHILPETIEEYGFGLDISLTVTAGILVFFVLEKFVHWHHCHTVGDDHHPKGKNALIVTNLMGDGLHNFVDGIFIASSYLVSPQVGIATTLAVILHEIPQEIGDFGVLIHGGIKRHKAILLNLFSGTLAMVGAVFGLTLGAAAENFLPFILPFTVGGFLYVSCTDLFPELHKWSDKISVSLGHFIMILAGLGTMLALLGLE